MHHHSSKQSINIFFNIKSKTMYRFVFTFIFIYFVSGIFAQKSEFGIGLGISSYYGDLGRDDYKNLHPAYQVFYNYQFNKYLNSRLSLGHGTISGNDSYSELLTQKERNLSFQSDINEFSGVLELNFLGIEFKINPYVYGGLNIFQFNPKTKFEGEWIYLRDLGTEGQGSNQHLDKLKYKLIETSIVFGAGIKIPLSKSIMVSFDLGWRRTNTDYLDDVGGEYINYNELLRSNGIMAAKLSDRTPEYLGIDHNIDRDTGSQRGGNKIRDYYVMSFINMTYEIHGGYPVKTRKYVKCPKF